MRNFPELCIAPILIYPKHTLRSLAIFRIRGWYIALFLLPALVLFAAFFIYPLIYVFGTSVTRWNGVSPPVFVGLQNYIDNFQDQNIRIAITNNVIWALCLGIIQVGLALVVALLLSQRPPGWRLLRTLYFLPNVVSKIAIATLWIAMYNAEYGAINAVLTAVGLEQIAINWLGNTTTALPSIIVHEVVYIGYFMIIIFAGRSSIPASLYDAARIDGANAWQQDIKITIPLLRPVLIAATTLAVAFGLRHFEATFLMTRGGPANSTTVLGLQMYNKLGALDYGHAAAISVTLIVLGVLLIGGIHLVTRVGGTARLTRYTQSIDAPRRAGRKTDAPRRAGRKTDAPRRAGRKTDAPRRAARKAG